MVHVLIASVPFIGRAIPYSVPLRSSKTVADDVKQLLTP